MSPVELNLKAVVVATVTGVVALYLLYSFYPKHSGMSKLKQHLTWKTRSFQDIPPDIKERAKTVKIIERTETINIDGEEVSVFFREADPHSEPKFPILLLHGMAFTSATWVEKVQSQTDPSVNTINLLAASGYKVIAVDLPGWGQSKTSVKEPQRARFLQRFIEQTKIARPVIVSPSMSGGFSLPYIMGSDPHSCEERARGYVPVAPVGTDIYTDAQYHRCQIPVMIVYGTKDVHLGLTSTNNLRNMANSEIFPMKDAKHPCYLDNPDEWHYNLYNFLLAVEREEGDPRQ